MRVTAAADRLDARVAARLRLVVGALDNFVTIMRQVVLRAGARERRQVEARLTDGTWKRRRIGAAQQHGRGLHRAALAEHEGARASLVVARDGRVQARQRVQVGQQRARVAAALGAARLVEAVVAQVAARRAAPPRDAGAPARRRRVVGLLHAQRPARAARARGRARRVDVALRQLVLEPLGRLLKARGMLR